MKKNIISVAFASAALLLAVSACEKEFNTELNTVRTTDTDISQYLPTVVSGDLKLGTYNLWIATKGEGDYAWANRKEKLAQSIVDNNFDVFGFQEADATIRNELPALVKAAGKTYEWWFVCRDNQAATSGEALGIAFDASRFTLTDRHYFWLSNTPDICSYGWDETGYHRMACSAVVTEIATDKKFFLMVTHAPLAATARAEAAALILSRETIYNVDKLPSFFVGDLNANPDDASTAVYKGYYKDAYSAVSAISKSGPVGTFNGHNTSKDMSQASARIDYIYFSNSATVMTYRSDNSVYGSIYPSDHFPVSITFNVSASTPTAPPSGEALVGDGSEGNPWQIENISDWNTVAASINSGGSYSASACYKITSDLDFTGQIYTPFNNFGGVLDGDCHSMVGITGEAAAANFGGVIHNLSGTVMNLHVEANLSSAYENLAGVVGYSDAGSLIDGVTFRGNLTGTGACSRIGGIVGTAKGVVVNCGCLGGEFLAGSATKSENIGGIAGRIEQITAMMFNCYSFLDKIVSSNNNLGGITGGLGTNAYCANVYATTTDITGGGTYCGCIGYSKSGNIRNVYTSTEAAASGNSVATTPWVANDKLASDWNPSYGASLPLSNMKSGAVALPSSGVSYESFVAALNAGVDDFNAIPTTDALKGSGTLFIVNKPSVTLRKWVADPVTGYPVIEGGAPSSSGGDSGSGGSGDDGPTTLVEVDIPSYGAANSWPVDKTNGYNVESFTVDGVTFTASWSGTTVNGVYWETDWRFYQARGGGLTISAPAGKTLVNAQFTYNNKNNGVLIAPDGATRIPSGGACSLSGNSASFTLGNTGDATNGQVRMTKMVVEYK
mgnify:FL=1